jgi:hypothetical protein
MVIIPKESPVIENLNTYYLDVIKLIEHYQGEIGAGGIYFKSAAAQGVIYFDHDDILNGYYGDKDGELFGDEAIDLLMGADHGYNFNIAIYYLTQEEVYFWSSLPTSERVYKDLSTEFTDLEGLIKNMSTEKLTGYIDVTIDNGRDQGLVFISNGEIIGGSFSWGKGDSSRTKEDIKLLIEKTQKSGGVFQVSKMPIASENNSAADALNSSALSGGVLKMLEEFMVIFETLYASLKSKDADFNSLLRKKFVDNADRFSFLDPFADEFEYANRKISFTGEAGDEELAQGVIMSMKEIAEELVLVSDFKRYLESWFKKYARKLDQLGIRF